jgi:hypothetical protein
MREYHKRSKWLINHLKAEHKDYLPAGSAGGGYFTPYRETMDGIKRYITAHPGCTLKDIMANLDHHHYASAASARSCIRTALSGWEKEWCGTDTSEKEFKYFVK